MKAHLTKRGIAFTEAASPDALPAKTKVADRRPRRPDAARRRPTRRGRPWRPTARGVLVLDQDNPLHYQAVPGRPRATDCVGRVAFPENLDHPIFPGLGTEDFFCLVRRPRRLPQRLQEGVARRPVAVPVRRGVVLLGHLPNARVNDGLLLLCQTVVGEQARLRTRWPSGCSTTCSPIVLPTSRPPKETVVVLAEGDLRMQLLDARRPASTARPPTCWPPSPIRTRTIVVVDATPENLKKLARRRRRAEAVHRPRRLADALGPDAGRAGRLQQGRRASSTSSGRFAWSA